MNTKNVIVAIVVVIIVIGGIYYFMQQYSAAPVNQNNNNVVKTGNTVDIRNFAFNPATLTVKVGTTVTWINNDSVTHAIKSDTFNSGNLAKGQTDQYTFNNRGTFDYSCRIHPSMKGQIIVQ